MALRGRPSSRNVRTSFKDLLFGNYSSGHIMNLIRSAKQRAELKNVPFGGEDEIYTHVANYLAKTPVCECCNKPFHRKEDGVRGGGKDSLSLHRVVASQGYVPSNIKVICQECNNAIGEVQNMNDLSRKFDALAWQTKIMEGG